MLLPRDRFASGGPQGDHWLSALSSAVVLPRPDLVAGAGSQVLERQLWLKSKMVENQMCKHQHQLFRISNAHPLTSLVSCRLERWSGAEL